MTIISELQREIDQEAATTRKMLALIPEDKFDWRPHAKSMTMEQLANHIAELPSWIGVTLQTDELDFAKNPYEPTTCNNTKDLLHFFEETLKEGKRQLSTASSAQLGKEWTLRHGDQVFSKTSKLEVLRMTFCQIVHHRAQLGVYLRLLNIPIPGSYGPSADEKQAA